MTIESEGSGAAVDTRYTDRFWAKVYKGDGDDCWLWRGSRDRWGYGLFSTGGRRKIHRTRLTHRFAWELHAGAIPDGMMVLHRCDIPACVRPDHLFLGTNADNVRDMLAKGRAAHQEIEAGRRIRKALGLARWPTESEMRGREQGLRTAGAVLRSMQEGSHGRS